MNHVWSFCKLFFEWIPHRLPLSYRLDGDFLLVLPRLHPEVVYLNRPAAFVLEQCDGKTTVIEILKRYMVEFLRADRGPAAWEVLKVLRQLERRLAIDLIPPENVLDAPR